MSGLVGCNRVIDYFDIFQGFHSGQKFSRGLCTRDLYSVSKTINIRGTIKIDFLPFDTIQNTDVLQITQNKGVCLLSTTYLESEGLQGTGMHELCALMHAKT